MHLKRWITSIVALPLLILLISKGGAFLFAMFVGCVSVVALKEYYCIVFNANSSPLPKAMVFFFFISGLSIIIASFEGLFHVVTCLIALQVVFAGLFSIVWYGSDKDVFENVAKQAQGVFYVPFLLSYMILIRNSNDGIVWVFFLLVLVLSGDTGAFYTGTYLGRRKLCPLISPGKTIEGAAGGFAATLLAGIAFKYFFLAHLSWVLCGFFFICISLASQAGDLFESVLKRKGGIKDSGTVLPGHGGILDRIDALLFAAPVAYIFKTYVLY
jgi:phosphatidate cytidylyltransferase